MGGYQPGNDIELDQAVNLVPKIYKSMLQSPQSPRSDDAFRDLAEALQPGSDDLRSLSALFRPDMPPHLWYRRHAGEHCLFSAHLRALNLCSQRSI